MFVQTYFPKWAIYLGNIFVKLNLAENNMSGKLKEHFRGRKTKGGKLTKINRFYFIDLFLFPVSFADRYVNPCIIFCSHIVISILLDSMKYARPYKLTPE